MVCSRNVTFGLNQYLCSGGDKQEAADVAAELLESRIQGLHNGNQARKSTGQAIRSDMPQPNGPPGVKQSRHPSVPDEGNLPSPEQYMEPDGSEEVHENPLTSVPLIDSPESSYLDDVTPPNTPARQLPSGTPADGITFELPDVVIESPDTSPEEVQGPRFRVRNVGCFAIYCLRRH